MIRQNPMLYGKIKIGAECERQEYSTQQFSFYEKYSYFTLKALRKSSYQLFLSRMLALEHIDETTVNTIVIKVYPASRKNGNTLAGRCNVFRGRIRIYPRTIRFCNVFSKKFGRETLFTYAGNRARAALIHELLHLKYTCDEKKVRELTKSYFSKYSKNHGSNALHMYEFVFNAKKIFTPSAPT